MPRRPWIFAALACLLLIRVGAAQVLTGSLLTTVLDQDGRAISGVQVRITSPALIGNSTTATTAENGQARFPTLPPGSYDVEVTMPSLFAPPRTVRIGIATVYLNILMTLQKPENVDVTGTATDRLPGFGNTIGQTQLTEIPTRRSNGAFGLIGEAPGISPLSQSSVFFSAFGAGIDQNAFLVDGSNVTATSNGAARSEPGVDFIEEIHVQSIGASAEYGNVQGAVVEFVMRQGGDRFLWNGSYYGQPGGLTSQPFKKPIDDIGPLESGYERQHYNDVSTTLGGPIVRDRVWFFAGYQYLRDEDSQAGADPDYPKDYSQSKAFGKFTWQLAPRWKLVNSFHGEFWDNLEAPSATKRPDATQRLQASVPAITLGHLTYTPSANRVWDMSAGWFVFSQDISRRTGDPNAPGILDRKLNVMSGAPTQTGEVRQERWTAKATFNQYMPGVAGADHDLRIGGQFERGEHRALLIVPTGVRYEQNPARKFVSDPSQAGGRFLTGSLFATDAFTLLDRLTITAGLRFDHSRAYSPDIDRLAADGTDTGETIEGLGLLYTWNVFSPRIGAAWKLTDDGKTIVRGSYGRYSQGVLTGELSGNHPGQAATTSYPFDQATGNYSTDGVKVDPKENVLIDPGTQAPRTDAYSIGVDREIGRALSVGVVYVHKNGSQFIGYADVGGQYDDKGTVNVNGQTLQVFKLVNLASDRRFELTNQDDYFLEYNGVAVAFEKRRSNGWQASGSYTWSRASGLQPSSGTSASGGQVATVGAPPVSFAPPVTFGRDPNSLTNATGRLPNDRPHLFRVMGSVDVPKVGMLFAGNLQYASGKPWAQTHDLTAPVVAPGQQTVRILLEPRGTRRLSSQTILDLRASKSFALGGTGRIELCFDVLNVLNDTAEESIASDRWDSGANLGAGNLFVDPRRVMLSLKVSLGR